MAEADENIAELPLESAGAQLRRAREAAGLSRSDISARTKIAERHLTSIEDGNFGAMASRTYAVGFSRNYARALGLDEAQIAETVRAELAAVDFGEDRRQVSAFEPGDPARVPGARLAWLAAFGGLAILLAGIVFLWRSLYAPGATLPELTATETPAPAAASGSAVPAPQGAVTFTALEAGVWVKFYDASGTQLMQKEMRPGESYTVPAEANGPMLWTARPNALQITVGGKALPKLSEKQQTMKDVPVTAAALVARLTAPSATATAPGTVAASPVPRGRKRPVRALSPDRPRGPPRPHRPPRRCRQRQRQRQLRFSPPRPLRRRSLPRQYSNLPPFRSRPGSTAPVRSCNRQGRFIRGSAWIRDRKTTVESPVAIGRKQ